MQSFSNIFFRPSFSIFNLLILLYTLFSFFFKCFLNVHFQRCLNVYDSRQKSKAYPDNAFKFSRCVRTNAVIDLCALNKLAAWVLFHSINYRIYLSLSYFMSNATFLFLFFIWSRAAPLRWLQIIIIIIIGKIKGKMWWLMCSATEEVFAFPICLWNFPFYYPSSPGWVQLVPSMFKWCSSREV